MRCHSGEGIQGAEATTWDIVASSRVRKSAAWTMGQTSAVTPLARRVLAVFNAATPSPMWLMFLPAAKFLYASATRPGVIATVSPSSTEDSKLALEPGETPRQSKCLKEQEMIYFVRL
jgi:hypothetical protein